MDDDLTGQEIRDRFDCREVAEELGVELSTTDMAECWIHDDRTPSLKVFDSWWYCHGCGATGDVIALVSTYMGCSLGKARQFLVIGFDAEGREPVRRERREDTGIDPSFVAELGFGISSMGMIPDGCSYDSVRGAGVRYQEEGPDCLMVPHDQGVKRRWRDGRKDSVSGSRFKRAYDPYRFIHGGVQPLVLMEGESDVWAYYTWATAELAKGPGIMVGGPPLPIGMPSGVNSWNPEIQAQLEGRKVWICFDNDEAGRKGRDKIERALNWTAERLEVPGVYKDAREALVAGWQPFS